MGWRGRRLGRGAAERLRGRRRADHDRETGQAQPPVEGLPPDEPDFASEHQSVTFADQQPGGPEGAPGSESPEGFAGLESRVIGRHRRGGI
jgi:hypothetical protein